MIGLARALSTAVKVLPIAGVAAAGWIVASSSRLDGSTVLPAGFSDTIVLSGLTTPTVVDFASDGRVFVGEKSGLIKVFDGLSDLQPSVFADLRTQVYNFGDRGLLGMALDPGFPTSPYVYVLYTRDAVIAGTAPKWGTPGVSGDPCPMAADVGCVASGRLARLEVRNGAWTGVEQVLVDGWFQQFDSHSMGAIAFSDDGALYASGGEAASWQFVDYGQAGNPGGDPPLEGGALRAQDLRTSGDPAGLSGTVIRVNRATGAALPDNPLIGNADVNARRIVAYGLRNPFRIAVRPGTRELWVGDVGWQEHEELDIVPDPAAALVPNFGWPCYDGTFRQDGYDAANLPICEELYANPSLRTGPFFQYRENYPVVAGETCINTDQSLSGLAFYRGGAYPSSYDGGLFFADYTRRCIYFMPAGPDGRPLPDGRTVFAAQASYPVDLKIGPGGDLFYVDIAVGAVHRIQFGNAGSPPVAALVASPTSGKAPLVVSLNATASVDPEGGALRYGWDLDGDGAYDDSSLASLTSTFSVNGTYRIGVQVTDPQGLTDVESTTITVGNTAPVPVIDAPATTLRWSVGQAIAFSGHAADAEQGTLPASALSWSTVLNHCSTPTSCHQHPLQEFAGVAGGSFPGPDHEYPSYVTLRLTATDAGGLKTSVERRLDPQAVILTLASTPTAAQLVLDGTAMTTPASRTVIAGSHHTIGAPSPQIIGGSSYTFVSWSDNQSATHSIVASAAATYTATFAAGATAMVPSPWRANDVGAVGPAGQASYSAGVFTVSGAGADVWGTSDAFQYVNRPFSGDGEIVARVASLNGIDAWTKAGVMLRSTLDSGSAHAFMLVSRDKGVAFQRRVATGAVSTHTAGGNGSAPQWLRLTRAGDLITAAVSVDGLDWMMVGSDRFTMPASILVGLAVSSHSTSAVATGTFDSVSVTGGGSLPPKWTSVDVGAVGKAGTAAESGGTYTVTGSGMDIWNTGDEFQFANRPISGDFDVQARVASVANVDIWTKAGIMIRENTTPGSPHASMFVTPSTAKGSAFQRRPSANAASISTAGPLVTAPTWLRLERRGNMIRAFTRSSAAAAWGLVGEQQFTSLPVILLVGLAVTSHIDGTSATATFDNVSIVGRFQSADIGAVGATGSTIDTNGTVTLSGAGADIWGTVDAFRYYYRPVTGNATITVRVASLEPTNDWAKAGVMFRETLATGSRHVMAIVSPAKGTAVQLRSSTGGSSTNLGLLSGAPPRWLRLSRSGDVFAAATSLDGNAWTSLGAVTMTMGASIYVGLPVTSHVAGTLATGVFDNIALVE